MELMQKPTDRTVWDTEILEHLPALHRYALGLSRNFHTAEDLVNDTIVKAYSCIEKFQPGSNLRAWLFTILRNTFYSGLRKQKHEVADPDGIYASTQITLPDHDGRLAMTEFFRAFLRLSPEHRDIITLVGVSGYSYEEASKVAGIAVGTAKSRLSRARAQLNETFDAVAVARPGHFSDCPTVRVSQKSPQQIKVTCH